MNLGGQRGASCTGQPDTKCLLSSKKNLRGKLTFYWFLHTIKLDSSASYRHHGVKCYQPFVCVCQQAGAVFKHVPSAECLSYITTTTSSWPPKHHHHHPSCNAVCSQWDARTPNRQARICGISADHSVNQPWVHTGTWVHRNTQTKTLVLHFDGMLNSCHSFREITAQCSPDFHAANSIYISDCRWLCKFPYCHLCHFWVTGNLYYFTWGSPREGIIPACDTVRITGFRLEALFHHELDARTHTQTATWVSHFQ